MTRSSVLSCLCLWLVWPAAATADEPVELAARMSDLQYFVHKTTLAVDGKNRPLAEFYTHETEEVIEDLETIESYEGHPIGGLVESVLQPPFWALESALDDAPWQEVSGAVDQLINACNRCHRRTAHEFIAIQRTPENPFMQRFTPAGQ